MDWPLEVGRSGDGSKLTSPRDLVNLELGSRDLVDSVELCWSQRFRAAGSTKVTEITQAALFKLTIRRLSNIELMSGGRIGFMRWQHGMIWMHDSEKTNRGIEWHVVDGCTDAILLSTSVAAVGFSRGGCAVGLSRVHQEP